MTGYAYSKEEIDEELMAQREELSAAIENLNEQNQELQRQLLIVNQRNNELDQLIYRMYHDIKSPVSSAKGLIQIREHISQEEFTNHLSSNIQKMEHILYSMIEFAQSIVTEKSETIQIGWDQTRTMVTELIDQQYSFNNQSINWSWDEKLNSVHFNNQLTTILKHLISNSIVFNQGNPKLQIDVHAEKNQNMLVLTVKDNGVGMDLEVSKNCTQMFYRGSVDSQGSGLGLYIVKNLVELNQGELLVESSIGNGVKVTIYWNI